MDFNAILQNIVCNLRLQPIYTIEEHQVVGWELLSKLREGIHPEYFFSSQSLDFHQAFLCWQLQVINNLVSDTKYFLNLPADLLCQQHVIDKVIPLLRPCMVVEIQDTHNFLTLNSQQLEQFIDSQQKIKSCGVDIWLDDVRPEYFSSLTSKFSYFDGVKIDKEVIWDNHSTPEVFNTLVAHLKDKVKYVLVEGIQNQYYLKLAENSDCDMLQGHYWPEAVLNVNYLIE